MDKTTEKNKKAGREMWIVIAVVFGIAIVAVIAMLFGHWWRNRVRTFSPWEMVNAKFTDAEKRGLEEAGWVDNSVLFSKLLNKNGLLTGVKLEDYVVLCDYKNIPEPGEMTEKYSYLDQYLLENCTVKEYPEYFEVLKEQTKAVLVKRYEDSEATYLEAYGKHQFANVYEAYKMTEEEFDAFIAKSAEQKMKKSMILQCIFEKEGLKIGEANISPWLQSIGSSMDDLAGLVYQHGNAYVKHMLMEIAVYDYLIP